MKVLIGAAVAALFITVSAAAQVTPPTTPATPATETPAVAPTIAPTACPALTPAPTLPDGAHANADAMQAGNDAYQAWATAYQAALVCRRTEVDNLRATEQVRRTEYNDGAATLNTTTQAWVAEAAEFNARPARNRH